MKPIIKHRQMVKQARLIRLFHHVYEMQQHYVKTHKIKENSRTFFVKLPNGKMFKLYETFIAKYREIQKMFIRHIFDKPKYDFFVPPS